MVVSVTVNLEIGGQDVGTAHAHRLSGRCSAKLQDRFTVHMICCLIIQRTRGLVCNKPQVIVACYYENCLTNVNYNNQQVLEAYNDGLNGFQKLLEVVRSFLFYYHCTSFLGNSWKCRQVEYNFDTIMFLALTNTIQI